MSSANLAHRPNAENEPGEAIINATLIEPVLDRTGKRPTTTQVDAKRSPLEVFLDSFFHRENIRWLAVTGAAIVVASSLMMVTREWANWPVLAKFLTILGYTGLTYLFSDMGRKHLGLQITARVLQFLTLLLLPICFLSLSWLFAPTGGISGVAGLQMLLLMAPVLGLAWLSASRIFEYLWRSTQPTFLASYLILCVAGALPRMHDAWPAAMITFALWLVATVGAVKINRHIFWITEEHRLPRAFGFLPIALLTVQFLSIVAIKTGMALPIEWMGLGLVLMSITVLMTARAVADVHRQRTGGNMRPLPWNILAPLGSGIAMSLFGVALSFHGFSFGASTTYAVIPSALLAGLMMFQATRETNQRAFVWIGLVLMLISYQCAPTLCAGLVDLVKSSAASAVGEERLPLAFYGLSYLPFLLTVAVAGSWLAHRSTPTFAIPLRHFVTFLSLVLFAVSWTHLKASFPVAMVNLALFSFYAILFRDRRYMLPAIAALTVAAGMWVPFANAMQLADIPTFHVVTSLCLLATVLAAIPQLDRLINQLPQPSSAWRPEFTDASGQPMQLCRTWATILSVAMIPLWLLGVGINVLHSQTLTQAPGANWEGIVHTIGLLPLAILLVNLAVLTLRTRSLYFSLGLWCLVGFSGAATAVYLRVPAWDIVSGTTMLCAVVGFAARVPVRHIAGLNLATAYLPSESRAQKFSSSLPLYATFLWPLHHVCGALLLLLSAVITIPTILASNAFLMPLPLPLATLSVWLWWIAMKLAFRHRVAGVAAAGSFPLLCSALVLSADTWHLPAWFPGDLVQPMIAAFAGSYEQLPLIWTVAGLLMSLSAYHSQTDDRIFSVKAVAVAWILLCAGLSLGSFSLSARLTALIALTSLAAIERQRFNPIGWTVLAIAGNLQILMLVMGLSGVEAWFTALQSSTILLNVLPPLALTLAISVAAWDIQRIRFDEKVRVGFKTSLRILFMIIALGGFAIPSATALQTAIVLLAFTVAGFAEVAESVRRQHAAQVWSSFAIALAALSWMISQGQLVIGSGASQAILIGVSAVGLLGARILRDQRTLNFAAQPLEQLGLACPAVVVGLTLFRNAMGVVQVFPGVDSAMLLAAAAIYFHRGLATSNRGFLIASALVFNIASIHLWLSLSIHDLQFYFVPLGLTIIALVQLLKQEIPASARNTIRNIGALVILASPVFEILGGSWLHLMTLLVLCLLVIMLSIGLRIRTLIYLGSVFLCADLVAMVILSAVENPGMLWIGGLAIGIAVIALAAICENRREQLLSKIRMLSAELATWN